MPIPRQWGYLPHYTADICGVFEVVDRPDKAGKCLRQVVEPKGAKLGAGMDALHHSSATSIGPDYEVSADIFFDNGGWAGVMGRVNATGNGWDGDPNGYYARLDTDGTCAIYIANQRFPSRGSRDQATRDEFHPRLEGRRLAQRQAPVRRFRSSPCSWTARPSSAAENATFGRGMAGLITGGAWQRAEFGAVRQRAGQHGQRRGGQAHRLCPGPPVAL